MSRRLLPSGDAALLVECDSLDEVLALHDALAADPPRGVVELVPAARTILVSIDPARMPLESGGDLGAAHPGRGAARGSPAHAADAVTDHGRVRRRRPRERRPHCSASRPRRSSPGTRRSSGGSRSSASRPGFGYLVSDDWPFEVPRLDAPRTRVPAGAVALAGAFGGVYPRQSPGGWRLIGRTDARTVGPRPRRAGALAPGRRVRFEAVGAG